MQPDPAQQSKALPPGDEAAVAEPGGGLAARARAGPSGLPPGAPWRIQVIGALAGVACGLPAGDRVIEQPQQRAPRNRPTVAHGDPPPPLPREGRAESSFVVQETVVRKDCCQAHRARFADPNACCDRSELSLDLQSLERHSRAFPSRNAFRSPKVTETKETGLMAAGKESPA